MAAPVSIDTPSNAVSEGDQDSLEIQALLDIAEIQRIELIGSGSYGEVWKASYDGQIVAIKIPFDRNRQAALRRRESLKSSDTKAKMGYLDSVSLRQLKKEIQILTSKRHPNLLMMMGFCMGENGLSVITEYCSNGDLASYFKTHESHISVLQTCEWRVQVAQGLRWLHGHPCVLHLDLKLENVFLDVNLRAKIGDFGISSITQHKNKMRAGKDKKHPVGNMLHEAPEVMGGIPFDSKADVYGYAILCWEITYHREWDADFSDEELEAKSVDDLIDLFERGVVSGERRPHYIDGCKDFHQLLEDCWNGTPQLRPSFQEIVPRLKMLTVTSLIQLNAPQEFWRNRFGSLIKVPFSQMLSNLVRSPLIKMQELLSDDDSRRFSWALMHLLHTETENSDVIVDIFGRFSQFFFTSPPVSPSLFIYMLKSSAFLPFVRDEHVFFHLEDKPTGTRILTYPPSTLSLSDACAVVKSIENGTVLSDIYCICDNGIVSDKEKITFRDVGELCRHIEQKNFNLHL